eukprot:TRINITY_DN23227_c0_g1_i1.p1 TRINITY_DN23227_c0_g1~~TRINITY_DN23227_c0_g1_i1.p1  ORF type:complete len:567 (+),score=111.08 TRINITY_DN23227_c0_g1_i1:66-1703(+)
MAVVVAASANRMARDDLAAVAVGTDATKLVDADAATHLAVLEAGATPQRSGDDKSPVPTAPTATVEGGLQAQVSGGDVSGGPVLGGAAAPVLTIVGRVTSRRRVRKGVIFYDVLAPRGVKHEGRAYFKVELKCCFEDEKVEQLRAEMHAGDVVEATGRAYQEAWGKPHEGTLDILVDTVEVVERWAVLNERGITCLLDKTLDLQRTGVLRGDGSFVVLQVNFAHLERVERYFLHVHGCELERSGSGLHGSDWVLALPRGVAWPVDDPVLNGPHTPVRRLYKVESAWATLSSAVEELCRLIVVHGVERIRISAFPPRLSEQLVNHAAFADVALDPKNFTHCASVVYFHGGYLVGVHSTLQVIVGPTLAVPSHICKAYYKMEEICCRTKWSEDLRGGVVVDVGAAPGGWSWYLTEAVDMRQAYAVDPGALELPGNTSRIEHLSMLGLEALPLLTDKQVRVDLYACDANMHPVKAIDTLVAFRDAGLLRGDCRVAVTLKNMCKNKAQWEAVLSAQLGRFRDVCPKDVMEVHLLANTKFETTLLGRCSF